MASPYSDFVLRILLSFYVTVNYEFRAPCVFVAFYHFHFSEKISTSLQRKLVTIGYRKPLFPEWLMFQLWAQIPDGKRGKKGFKLFNDKDFSICWFNTNLVYIHLEPIQLKLYLKWNVSEKQDSKPERSFYRLHPSLREQSFYMCTNVGARSHKDIKYILKNSKVTCI